MMPVRVSKRIAKGGNPSLQNNIWRMCSHEDQNGFRYQLEQQHLARLIDYMDVASENGATELIAALLAYREKHSGEYRGVDSLLLDRELVIRQERSGLLWRIKCTLNTSFMDLLGR